MTLTIRPATANDLVATKKLLQAAGLPTADLAAGILALAAEKDNKFQGIIGIEVFGECALLRSLVVSPDTRRSGIGLALVTALEVMSLADGVRELWLLTIDADSFFAKLGYLPRGRADAPEPIRRTKEFSGLCPGDAVLMSKSLSQ